jgi:chromosome segregation ATPase
MVLVRIYDSVNLRYTLHADIEILDSSGRTDFQYTPVLYFRKFKEASADKRSLQIIVRENTKVSCQLWLFAGCEIDQTQFNRRANVQTANILVQYEKKVKDQWAVGEEARGVRDRETVRSTELGGQLQKAQMMNAELEAERTMYMRDNNLLRQELEKMRLANSGVQNKLIEKHTNEVKDLRKEMEEAIAKKDELRKEMKAERTRLRKYMEKCEAEKKRLADDLKSAQKGGGVSCTEERLQAIQQREEAFRKIREVNEKAGRQRKRLEEAIDALDQLSREKDDISRKLKDLESLKNRVNPYDRQQQQLIQELIDLAKLPIAAADRRHQELLQFMRAAIS